jgi:hypothetical protein
MRRGIASGGEAGRAFAERLISACLLVLGLVFLAAPAHADDIERTRLDICREAGGRQVCEPMTALNTSLRGSPEYVLVREVNLPPSAVHGDRPIMVVLIAMASSEIRWNGVVIGRNGRPGPDAASEVPGRFTAVYVVPPELVRPGRNVATARISSHHLPLPVMNAVHLFEVADYVDPMRVGLVMYLPALLMIGVLAVAGVYFTATALLDRGQEGAWLLAIVAWLGTVQLAVETLRVFVNYPYPWHVVRVGAIALLAVLTAIAAAAWALRRFRAPRPRLLLLAAGAAAFAALLNPGYDNKASGAIVVGLVALGGSALWGLKQRIPGAALGLFASAVGVALALWQGAAFLDRAYYLFMAVSLALMVAGQVLMLRRARAGHGAEAARADEAEAELARRDAATASIRDGARTHRVAVADILYLQAADDYCEVQLTDGRRLLSTASLTQALAELPGDFVRVHKSYAVNAEHVAMIGPRAGGRRAVTLSDGAALPVGRTYEPALARFAA